MLSHLQLLAFLARCVRPLLPEFVTTTTFVPTLRPNRGQKLMMVAESMRTAEAVPAEHYEQFKANSSRHDFLVCPSCGWEVNYFKAGGRKPPHFQHYGLSGDALYKRCPRYTARTSPTEGGGKAPPLLTADDRQTLNEVLQSYVIHLVAQANGFFGACGGSYSSAKNYRKHLWLLGEVELADAIAWAVKESGLARRWTVCTAAFLRFALASATADAETDIRPQLTPFRQLMAFAWSVVEEKIRVDWNELRLKPSEVPREQITVLKSWLFFMEGQDGWQPSLGPRPPTLEANLKAAIAAAPVEPDERRPKRLIAAMLIHAFLRIVEAMDIDRLIDDPTSLMPEGGFIYIVPYQPGKEVLGIKLGRTKNAIVRLRQHRAASGGALLRFAYIEFVTDDCQVEDRLKREMAKRRIRRMQDRAGAELGTEWFCCSVEEAVSAAYKVVREFRLSARERIELKLTPTKSLFRA